MNELMLQTQSEQLDNLQQAVAGLEPRPDKATSLDGVSGRLVEFGARASGKTMRLILAQKGKVKINSIWLMQ